MLNTEFLVFLFFIAIFYHAYLFIKVYNLQQENNYIKDRLNKLQKREQEMKEYKQLLFEKEYEEIYGTSFEDNYKLQR